MEPPDSNVRDAHLDQNNIHSELHTERSLAQQGEVHLYSDLQTKKRLGHQDESSFHAVWKMIKFEEVLLKEFGIVMSMQDLLKPVDVYIKSKLPMCLALDDDLEDSGNANYEDGNVNDMKNDEEVNYVYDDDEDVCDSMMEDVGSSINSPEVNKHVKVKTLVEEEVDKEPGGNVSIRSRSPRFRHSKA